MIIRRTSLPGVCVIELDPRSDERGHFARTFCAQTFRANGLDPHLEQISVSYNRMAGIVRGLHLQRPPRAETKLVRVTAGAIYDVIVDVRAGSPTYGRWAGFELSAESGSQLYIPQGFAHGFQTLMDATEVTYHISEAYAPEHADGIRWDDPALAISWPNPEKAVLSERDRGLPSFADFVPVDAPC